MIGTQVVRLKSKKKVDYISKVYDLSFVNDPYFFASAAGSADELKSAHNSLILSHNSPPDIDIDFTSGTDHIVDEFLIGKYGKERVFPVGTFSTFNEKGCLKDVVRAHYGSEGTGEGSDVVQITKEMPKVFGKSTYPLLGKYDFSLQEWFDEYPKTEMCSPVVKRWIEDPKNRVIIDQTLRLQGEVRGFGKHAAGVVITPREGWFDLPTSMIAKQETIITAFQEADGSSKDLSLLGILKLDRLKLSTINIVMDAVKMIKENHDVDIMEIILHIDEHFDDKNLYAELRLGMNHGIFQFESPGINALIKGINIDNFEEVVAANALYRPGPMGINAHSEYIHNKFNPEDAQVVHPALEPILRGTNGVMIFQEQVQFIAKEIAGMDLGEGDMLRRYMDKASNMLQKLARGEELEEREKTSKDYQNFLKYWNKFLEGAKANGYDEDGVNKIKDYMAKYLGYSFNKCLSENHVVFSETRGEIPMVDVKVGERVLGYNPDKKENEFVSVKNKHANGKKKVFRIKTESGKVLECTKDHKIMTEVGMRTLEDIIAMGLKVKV